MNPPEATRPDPRRDSTDGGLPAWLLWLVGGNSKPVPSGGEVSGAEGGDVVGGGEGGGGGGD